MAMVMPNCLYITPVLPPRKATGTYTAASTSTLAMMGPVTCFIALMVASLGDKCSSCIRRSTFSTATIALSTTMPIARTRANRVSVFTVNPIISNPVKVPMMDMGMATRGTREARQLPRNSSTTTTTSAVDCRKVIATSHRDTLMNLVVSMGMV
ncbi:MAG: hypothetical protein BWY09_01133 [Candidatus Hydrogenedentes bacterium ADurb.Bin179]|nr:MAG: hypothetical protein BWY09_01133 [Candidatus Hydrogenedentes bacterium ADurb.Bin179]